ncbi:MAG: cyclin family protein [Candidatus Babeliales bacterium]|jgi:hypothetical protein
MINKIFVPQTYLCLWLILTTVSILSGMAEKKESVVFSKSKYEAMLKLYTEEEKKLINLVFEKIIKIIVILNDDDQPIRKRTPERSNTIKEIDWSKIPLIDKGYSCSFSTFDEEREFSRPKDIRIFYGTDKSIPNEVKPIDYLHRIQTYFQCPASCYVIALIYIERFIDKIDAIMEKKGGSNIFNQFSCYRIFLAALTVATKCFSDLYYSNAYYAKVGGVGIKELWTIEHQFLMIMESDLNASLEEYNATATENLDTFIARRQRMRETKYDVADRKK